MDGGVWTQVSMLVEQAHLTSESSLQPPNIKILKTYIHLIANMAMNPLGLGFFFSQEALFSASNLCYGSF